MLGKKSKNNKGKKFDKDWVFGIVDTTNRILVTKIVDKRDSQTLIPIITTHVDQSCHINHDDWAVYRRLEQHGYSHSTVVHSREFVASDGTHTQGIEGVWGHIVETRSHSWI